MSELLAENIIKQIIELPRSEQDKLRQWLNRQEAPKPPLDKRLPPRPMPDSTKELNWVGEHAREFVGQWVALEGDRLIAHSTIAEEVFAAADADGAYLPVITFIEDPEKIYVGF